jgi:3-hydroxyacyl-[acyl-carrier-protein] dehydratase
MSLKNKLYGLIASDENIFRIRFNPSHPIFAGHFPGNPVVPGACLVQIAEELMSDRLARPICFHTINNMKFQKPITPEMEIAYKFDENKIEIANTDLTEIYAQFKATYLCTDPDVQ